MFYKALGYAVWNGVKWYAGHKRPSRKVLVGGIVTLGVATLVAVGAKRDHDG
jgi:phosphate/sulfate permease